MLDTADPTQVFFSNHRTDEQGQLFLSLLRLPQAQFALRLSNFLCLSAVTSLCLPIISQLLCRGFTPPTPMGTVGIYKNVAFEFSHISRGKNEDNEMILISLFVIMTQSLILMEKRISHGKSHIIWR